MFKKIFISHAKEDYNFAETIFNELKERGYSPWLDKKKLKVGSNWDLEIKKNLKDSDFIILLLSSTSVKKRGYVQKEFKYALEYSESKLDDDIYIIPILIDECEVPFHLQKFQWTKIETDYIENIIDSIEHQRKLYLEDLPKEEIEFNDIISEMSISLDIEPPIKIDYECRLPVFRDNKYFQSSLINSKIQNIGFEIISDTRKMLEDDYFKERLKETPFYLYISYYIKEINKIFLSLSINVENYFGGAHPNNYSYHINIAFNPEKNIEFRDLINIERGLKEELLDLIEHFSDDAEQKTVLLNSVQEEDYISDIEFNFDKENITLYFPLPRVVQCYSDLEIPLNKLNYNKKYFT